MNKPNTPAPKALRILLAEDNLTNQQLAVIYLERLGYQPDLAVNGEEVLMALRRQPYDIVLMDVQMPQMDGLEATRRLRAELPPDRQPYIIALTAGAIAGDRGACMKAGMNDFVSKPVLVKDLDAAFERYYTANKAPEQPEQSELEPEPVTPSTFDYNLLARLRQSLGRHAPIVIPQLVDTFLSEADAFHTTLMVAISEGQRTDICRIAHSLKSNSSTFGAQQLASLYRELEHNAYTIPLEQAQPLLDQILAEYSRVRPILETVRKQPFNSK